GVRRVFPLTFYRTVTRGAGAGAREARPTGAVGRAGPRTATGGRSPAAARPAHPPPSSPSRVRVTLLGWEEESLIPISDTRHGSPPISRSSPRRRVCSAAEPSSGAT